MVSPPWGQCLLNCSQTRRRLHTYIIPPLSPASSFFLPFQRVSPASTAALSPLSSIRLVLPVSRQPIHADLCVSTLKGMAERFLCRPCLE